MILWLLAAELVLLLLAVACLYHEVRKLRTTWDRLEWQLELARVRAEKS